MQVSDMSTQLIVGLCQAGTAERHLNPWTVQPWCSVVAEAARSSLGVT